VKGRKDMKTRTAIIEWCFNQFASEYEGAAIDAYFSLVRSAREGQQVSPHKVIAWAYDWQDYDDDMILGKINAMIDSLTDFLSVRVGIFHEDEHIKIDEFYARCAANNLVTTDCVSDAGLHYITAEHADGDGEPVVQFYSDRESGYGIVSWTDI
jgi:hypothetical protein